MITVDTLKNMLKCLGYSEKNNIWTKHFDTGVCMGVDFEKQQLMYPESIRGRDRNDNFEQNENFVVFECVDRLLSKGYKASDIELEKQWHLGHDLKSGRADICVYGPDKKMLLIIECKTYGHEYTNALKNTKQDGGQLFSYWQQEGTTKWLALYASDFINGKIIYSITTIRSEDDSQLLEVAKSDEDILLYKNAHSVPDKFKVWDETYHKESYDDLIFNHDTIAYHIGVRPLCKRDLKDFTPEDKIVNKFEEILRHNNVSDKENAFNRLVALFICKLVDESQCSDSDEVQFQYKRGIDTYETLQDRLQKLHKIGMEKFMREKMFYIESDYAERLFETYTGRQRKQAINELNKTIRILKFFSNNDFAFKDVHNEQLFYQNGKILVEIIELFQKYRIVYPSKHQFLGDLFEQLLNKGFKQNEGQFFTPMPITRFIWDSLPLTKYSSELPKIIDYACGAGHFLIEGIETINKHFGVKSSDWVSKNVYGIEKDYRLARVSKVSMFMNGAGESNIIFGDGLENYPEKGISDKSFDILVANPPYAVKGFKEHLKLKNNDFELLKQITINGSDIESLFVERIGQLVKPDGIVAVILPSSILQSGGSYSGAREHILKYFHLRAIVEMGNQTFGATGTNTVILFMQRRHEPPSFYDMVLDSVDAMLTGGDLSEWTDDEIFNSYLRIIGKDKSEFLKNILSLSQKDQQKVRQKLIYWTLCYNERVLVITAPTSNSEQKKFLGYEWSNSKGAEGIHITTPGGFMYDDKNRENPNTLAGLIRGTFNNIYDELPEKAEYYHWVKLSDMMNWGKQDFDNSLRTTAVSKIEIPTKWPLVKIGDLFVCFGKGKHPASFGIKNGIYKFIVSSVQEKFADSYDYDEELLLVGDGGEPNVHYTDSKIAVANHTYIFKHTDNKIKTKYAFYFLQNNLQILGRRFKGITIKNIAKSDIVDIEIPLPPIDVQQKIVDECSVLDELAISNTKKIKENEEKIKTKLFGLFNNAKSTIKLSDKNVFNLMIGKRVLNKDLVSNGNPVYSANVMTPFGFIEKDLLNSYDVPSILWGIDGDWMVKLQRENINFYPTDHCGVLRVIKNSVLEPKYLVFALDLKGKEYRFSRSNRASLDRVREIEIPLPDYKEQQKIVNEIEPLEKENEKMRSELDAIPIKKQEILDKYLL